MKNKLSEGLIRRRPSPSPLWTCCSRSATGCFQWRASPANSCPNHPCDSRICRLEYFSLLLGLPLLRELFGILLPPRRSSRTVRCSPAVWYPETQTLSASQSTWLTTTLTCALTEATPSGEPSSPQGLNTRKRKRSDNDIMPITLSSSSTTTSRCTCKK